MLAVCESLIKNLPVYEETLKNNSKATAFQAALVSIGITGMYEMTRNVFVRCVDKPDLVYKTNLITTKFFEEVSKIPSSFYEQGTLTLSSDYVETKNILEIGELVEYNKKVVEDDERNRSEYFTEAKLSKVARKKITGSKDLTNASVEELEKESLRDTKQTRIINKTSTEFVTKDVSEMIRGRG